MLKRSGSGSALLECELLEWHSVLGHALKCTYSNAPIYIQQ